MKTVLLVDDDSNLLAMYEEVFRRSEYSVIARPDGRSALAEVRKGRKVDLVITDCQMPGMDGFEFIANLKHIDPSVPVLMMSADVSTEKYVKALRLGAIECAEKPKNAMELARIAAAVLARPTDDGKTAKLNCWEVMRCGREQGGAESDAAGVCPAATDAALNNVHGGKNAGRACWAVAGTRCGRALRGTFAKKLSDCLKCEFFNSVRTEEDRTLFGFSATRPDMEEALDKLKLREQWAPGAGA